MATKSKSKHVGYASSSDEDDANILCDQETDSDKEDENVESIDQSEKKGKSGLADAMSKILRKKIPVHKQIILAKSKTDREITLKRKNKEEESDTVKVKQEIDDKNEVSEVIAAQEKKKLWEDMGRIKPDPLEKEKERKLQRIAQRGVVQLFNAVRSQQKIIEENMSSAGPTEGKKAKIIENMTKGKFLDMLKGTQVNVSSNPLEATEVKVKIEKEEDDKKWGILRDDFMMGAKMKDWDKESSDGDSDKEVTADQHNVMDSSDSDNG